jgi:chromate transporter
MTEPDAVPELMPPIERGSLREVATLFLKLGCIAFGGPAAHVAMMRQEVVQRRNWLSDQRFLDLFGAANLIPGPSSTELAIFLGYVRAGWPALILAGVLFIAPAMLMVLAFAWAYVHFGHLPAVGWLLYGIKPVIIAIIAQALYGLGRTAIKGPVLAVLGLSVLGFYFAGVNVILLLFGGALFYALLQNARRLRSRSVGLLVLPAGTPTLGGILTAISFTGASVNLLTLFLTFLKLGVVVYGSGYVLLAFLRPDFVQHLHWLTDQQLVDAVAVGQFTPGPVFTTATFLGYLFAGLPGALLATLGIFLPSFLFVPLVFPVVSRLRRSSWTSALLDGVNAAALGLMAAVALQLGKVSIIDPITVAVALVALAILLRFKPNSAWLVVGGGVVGVASRLLIG